MNGSYSTQNPKVPVVDFDMAITDFDIPTTFKSLSTVQKLAPIAKYATGKFSTQLKYVSNLDATMMPDMKTMNGDGRLQTKSVTISGFEPLNFMENVFEIRFREQIEIGRVELEAFTTQLDLAFRLLARDVEDKRTVAA